MFTQTMEYGLRAMALLAKEPERARTTLEIAQVTRVPPDYLSKVMKELVRAGLVRSQRGPSGGFRLSRSAGEITVLDVVTALGSVPRVRECPLGLEEHKHQLCPLHQLLDDAGAQVEAAFRKATLEALVRSTNEFADMQNPNRLVQPRIRGRSS